MQANWGVAPLSLGFIIAIIVLLLSILGMVGAFPMTSITIFGLIGALAIARLV